MTERMGSLRALVTFSLLTMGQSQGLYLRPSQDLMLPWNDATMLQRSRAPLLPFQQGPFGDIGAPFRPDPLMLRDRYTRTPFIRESVLARAQDRMPFRQDPLFEGSMSPLGQDPVFPRGQGPMFQRGQNLMFSRRQDPVLSRWRHPMLPRRHNPMLPWRQESMLPRGQGPAPSGYGRFSGNNFAFGDTGLFHSRDRFRFHRSRFGGPGISSFSPSESPPISYTSIPGRRRQLYSSFPRQRRPLPYTRRQSWYPEIPTAEWFHRDPIGGPTGVKRQDINVLGPTLARGRRQRRLRGQTTERLSPPALSNGRTRPHELRIKMGNRRLDLTPQPRTNETSKLQHRRLGRRQMIDLRRFSPRSTRNNTFVHVLRTSISRRNNTSTLRQPISGRTIDLQGQGFSPSSSATVHRESRRNSSDPRPLGVDTPVIASVSTRRTSDPRPLRVDKAVMETIATRETRPPTARIQPPLMMPSKSVGNGPTVVQVRSGLSRELAAIEADLMRPLEWPPIDKSFDIRHPQDRGFESGLSRGFTLTPVRQQTVQEAKQGRARSLSPDPIEIITSVQTVSPANTFGPSIQEIAKRLSNSLNTSVEPCDDFYEFACGNWVTKKVALETEGYSDVYSEAAINAEDKLSDLLAVPMTPFESLPEAMAKMLYGSCVMSENDSRNAAEDTPDMLDELGLNWPLLSRGPWRSWPFVLEDWLAVVRKLAGNSDVQDTTSVLIALDVKKQPKDGQKYCLNIEQPTLGLGRKGLYQGGRNSPEVKAYEKYGVAIATLLGAQRRRATRNMEYLVDFEFELSQLLQEDRGEVDYKAEYETLSTAALAGRYPKFKWRRFLRSVFPPGTPGLNNGTICLWHNGYFDKVFGLLDRTPKRTLANYVVWRFLMPILPSLGRKFRELEQNFRKDLTGRYELEPQSRFCARLVNTHMRFVTGRMYAEYYVSRKQRKEVGEILDYVIRAFRERLDALEWVDNTTREFALRKLQRVSRQVGFPDFIFDENFLLQYYLPVSLKNSMLENVIESRRFNTAKHLEKLRKTTSQDDRWFLNPMTAGASFSQRRNAIGVSIGTFQDPFYTANTPRSLAFGGLATTIGRKLTRGFDSLGSQYDDNGLLNSWWTDKTSADFRKELSCFTNSSLRHEAGNSTNHTGNVPSRGDIADRGGLSLGKRAYDLWLSEGGRGDLLRGLAYNTDQLFMIGFSQLHCARYPNAYSQAMEKIEGYTSPKQRTNEALRNFPEFSKAFTCPGSSPMVSSPSCNVW